MCGIAGIVLGASGSAPSVDDATAALRRMNGALAARGPDGEGIHVDAPCLLGHRRLAIIDVAGGRQPLFGCGGKVSLVVNGEIYNFARLRTELERAGHTFATRSDSEVIVHGYEAWGDAVLDRIEGMFALALWDPRKQRLLLARDRLGEKPLYYAALPGGGVAFASELRALKFAPGLAPTIDPAGLLRYLVLEDLPAPWTILSGVRKLEPGTAIVHKRGVLGAPRVYWDVPYVDPAVRLTDAEAAASILRKELERAVTERLVSDVPLGVFLSGGVDSSAVAALAARARGGDLDTFSIGFDDPTFDESGEARRVATHLGTRHHERRVSAADVQGVIAHIGALLDEPLGDGSIVPTHLLAKFAREHVTVALGGDGGDELFLGYPTFQAERVAQTFAGLPARVRRPVLALARGAARLMPSKVGYMSLDFKLRQFLKGVELEGARRHQAWMASFAPVDALQALAPGLRDVAAAAGDPVDIHDARLARCKSTDPWDRLQYTYLKGYLADGVLTKVDRASMAVGLEVRAPLLDREVVALAARIDPSLRLRGQTTKWIFKQAMRPLLPPETTARKKQGFAMPIGRWLRGELAWLLDEELGEARLRSEGIFDPAPIRRLVDEHRSGKADHRKPLWTLLAFQGWKRAFFT